MSARHQCEASTWRHECTLRNSRPRLLPRLPLRIPTPMKFAYRSARSIFSRADGCSTRCDLFNLVPRCQVSRCQVSRCQVSRCQVSRCQVSRFQRSHIGLLSMMDKTSSGKGAKIRRKKLITLYCSELIHSFVNWLAIHVLSGDISLL